MSIWLNAGRNSSNVTTLDSANCNESCHDSSLAHAVMLSTWDDFCTNTAMNAFTVACVTKVCNPAPERFENAWRAFNAEKSIKTLMSLFPARNFTEDVYVPSVLDDRDSISSPITSVDHETAMPVPLKTFDAKYYARVERVRTKLSKLGTNVDYDTKTISLDTYARLYVFFNFTYLREQCGHRSVPMIYPAVQKCADDLIDNIMFLTAKVGHNLPMQEEDVSVLEGQINTLIMAQRNWANKAVEDYCANSLALNCNGIVTPYVICELTVKDILDVLSSMYNQYCYVDWSVLRERVIEKVRQRTPTETTPTNPPTPVA